VPGSSTSLKQFAPICFLSSWGAVLTDQRFPATRSSRTVSLSAVRCSGFSVSQSPHTLLCKPSILPSKHALCSPLVTINSNLIRRVSTIGTLYLISASSNYPPNRSRGTPLPRISDVQDRSLPAASAKISGQGIGSSVCLRYCTVQRWLPERGHRNSQYSH